MRFTLFIFLLISFLSPIDASVPAHDNNELYFTKIEFSSCSFYQDFSKKHYNVRLMSDCAFSAAQLIGACGLLGMVKQAYDDDNLNIPLTIVCTSSGVTLLVSTLYTLRKAVATYKCSKRLASKRSKGLSTFSKK